MYYHLLFCVHDMPNGQQKLNTLLLNLKGTTFCMECACKSHFIEFYF